MNEEASYTIVDLKRLDIEALVIASTVPEFCWPINNFWTLQVHALDRTYCAECYLDELYGFVLASQRKFFADNTTIREGLSVYIYGDMVIDILDELEDQEFCCRSERWAVIACSNADSTLEQSRAYDGSDIAYCVNFINVQIDLHQGKAPAEP
jgi:hypothetical protein